MQVVTDWFKRYFSDPQVVFLALLLVGGFAVVLTMGDMLAPVLASVVIAYLLEGLVAMIQRLGVPRLVAVVVVFCVFLTFVGTLLLGILPLISRQVTDLVQQIPSMIAQGQKALMQLPERYPDIVTAAQIQDFLGTLRNELASWGQRVVSWSLASVVGLLTIVVYLILMPMLVFFFLKDKDLLINWFQKYMPRHRRIAYKVWHEVDRQVSNYVRGKFWEVVIIWSVSFATFSAFNLNYAMLLALLAGLSVIIPFVGFIVVTVPVLLIGWFQWGWTGEFVWLTIAYFVIQGLDANLLVPILFSEVVNLHPVAIIVAILVFGGLWGFWGVFFAIPLATLVQAVLSAWPREEHPASE